MSQKVLSYDLGGTKVAVGVITEQGKILEAKRESVLLEKGKDAVLDQLTELGRYYLERHPEITRIGIASAGPLDPKRGELLDPTNFSSLEGGRWGRVAITEILGQRFQRSVYLDNDAAAAVLAEFWIGAAKGINNVITLTLGTGLGTGIICNGKLVRSGRFLHPEAGHMIINFQDASAPCGCGNFGCAEAYLSGRNFESRMRRRFVDESLTNIELAARARAGGKAATQAFDEYAQILAIAIHNYVRIYSPELILFSGSFAATHDLFLEKTRGQLERLLKRLRLGMDMLPELRLAQLNNEAGLIGGAYIAIHSDHL
ncbi:ROK family protein [bacterium]|jgi:glucokinase|nr:ROK family protein [bacterium]